MQQLNNNDKRVGGPLGQCNVRRKQRVVHIWLGVEV